MPAKNPRINVVLEKPLYIALHDLAEDEGVSKSMVMRDLVKEALELREDRALADIAAEREKDFDRRKALSMGRLAAFIRHPSSIDTLILSD